MKIETGETLILTHVEYSNRDFTGPFRVLKSFDQYEISEEFKNQYVKENSWDSPDRHEFIGYLSNHGYIEDVECSTWFIGSYGFEPEFN